MKRDHNYEISTNGLLNFSVSQATRQNNKKEEVQIVPIELIDGFQSYPFKIRMDDNMRKMIVSISEYGILTPVLLRPKDGGRYEMVSGHKRMIAGVEAGLVDLPAIIRTMNDEESNIAIVDSNLQREKILPSEKAFAYKMKMDVMKKQRARTDLTLHRLSTNFTRYQTDEMIMGQSDNSARQVHRFICLTELIPPILEMVDAERIKFNPAVELSFLSDENQRILFDIMEAEQCTPSHSQAIRMKQAEIDGYLNKDSLLAIMQEEKGNQIALLKISQKSIECFFATDVKNKEAIETIVKALEYYNAHERNRNLIMPESSSDLEI